MYRLSVPGASMKKLSHTVKCIRGCITSCGCCNNLPHTSWFKKTQICILSKCEGQKFTSASLGKNQGVAGLQSLQRVQNIFQPQVLSLHHPYLSLSFLCLSVSGGGVGQRGGHPVCGFLCISLPSLSLIRKVDMEFRAHHIIQDEFLISRSFITSAKTFFTIQKRQFQSIVRLRTYLWGPIFNLQHRVRVKGAGYEETSSQFLCHYFRSSNNGCHQTQREFIAYYIPTAPYTLDIKK